eukprot:3416862-Rhodomonas_salina.2
MSGTAIAYGAICLHACDAMSGTDIAHAATVRPYGTWVIRPRMLLRCIGNKTAYAATVCQLKKRMVLQYTRTKTAYDATVHPY